MPSQFNTPGVYIQEVSTLPASVVGVETAIPAFIGYTENDVEPARITSFLEFENTFGGPADVTGSFIDVTVTTSGTVHTVTAPTSFPTPTYILYYCMQLYFANGGGPCYVVSAGAYKSTGTAVEKSDLKTALDKLEYYDEPTLIVIPEAVRLSNTLSGELVKDVLAQCADLQDRFGIFDTTDPSVSGSIAGFRDNTGTQNLKYGACYYPWLNSTIPFPDEAIQIDHAAFTSANNETIAELKVTAETNTTVAAYLNEVLPQIQKAFAGQTLTLPPSAAMAGIYATVDRTRGVWKAPANISLNGISGPTLKITNTEQGDLNVDATSGKSINAIRSFTGKGTLVWGSRTLAGNDNEWRYVPVRRLFNYVEESIQKATEFVVFEPNDANTWQRVKAMCENFLTGVWRDGGLAGATTKEAFYVNIGLGSTMTAQDILEGKLIVEIGMAAVRPAEFIVLKFSHKIQES